METQAKPTYQGKRRSPYQGFATGCACNACAVAKSEYVRCKNCGHPHLRVVNIQVGQIVWTCRNCKESNRITGTEHTIV